MKKLVLVEDDALIAETLRVTLSYRGFAITVADTVGSAFRVLERSAFDIAVLDVALPDGDGFELCRKIRASDPDLPILMLTARTDESSAVTGINCGADDYVRKPCGLEELTVRLNRLLGRRGRVPKSLAFGSLHIDPESRQAYAGSQPLSLRRREFDILLVLMKNAGDIVSRERILNAIDQEAGLMDRAIDSHLCRLRGKLRKAGLSDVRIASIYGIGYRLEAS